MTRVYLDEHRDQLWAEACHRTRELHQTAYLPDSLKGAQSKLTDQYRAVDEVAEEVIGAWLDNNPGAVTAYKIASGINWTPDSRSVYRITTVLKQMGYTRLEKRVSTGAGRMWVWLSPGGPAQAGKSLLPVVVAFLLPPRIPLTIVGNGTHRHGLFQEPMEERSPRWREVRRLNRKVNSSR